MADVLAGPLLWGGVGWLADRWLGTDPWFLAVGVMLGFAGGFCLVWVRSTRLRAGATARPPARKVAAAGSDEAPATGRLSKSESDK